MMMTLMEMAAYACFKNEVTDEAKESALLADRMARVEKKMAIMRQYYDSYCHCPYEALRRFNLPEPPMIPRPAIPGRNYVVEGVVRFEPDYGIMVEQELNTDKDRLATRLIEYTEVAIGQMRQMIVIGSVNTTMICIESTQTQEKVFCPACLFAKEMKKLQPVTRAVGRHVKEECCCMFPTCEDDCAESLVRHVHTLGRSCSLHELVWTYILEMASSMVALDLFVRASGMERTTLVNEILTRASWKLNDGPPINWPRKKATKRKRARDRDSSHE